MMQLWSGESYHVWVAAVGAVGGILAMILVRRHQPLAASIILIASLFTMALIYVILFEDIATNLTIIIAILCVGIAIQTIPAEKIGWAIGLIVATTVSLVILDQFWPAPREHTPPQTAAIITLTGGVTILILIITVIRQFPSFFTQRQAHWRYPGRRLSERRRRRLWRVLSNYGRHYGRSGRQFGLHSKDAGSGIGRKFGSFHHRFRGAFHQQDDSRGSGGQ
ncbi:MAG: hypothetical protein M5U34_18725 [Chloroflexi bacterium]|nr:hypothetical protein [Chloroflexota bacterium]